MANVNSPFGLRPVKHLTSGTPGRVTDYAVASAYGSNIFSGDAVILTNTTKRINVATAGARLVGVFWGCNYTGSDGRPKFSRYWPASTATLGSADATAYVFDDPHIIFEVQMSGAYTDADIGLTINLLCSAGSTTTGTSGFSADSTDEASSGTKQLLIKERSPRPDNASGTYAVVNALIDLHYYNAGMTAL